jgi:hypothetical protein
VQDEQRRRPMAAFEHEQACVADVEEMTVHAPIVYPGGRCGVPCSVLAAPGVRIAVKAARPEGL